MSLDTLSRLNDSSGPKDRLDVLTSIPASSEFWLAVHHAFQPLVPYSVAFGLTDPPKYGPGAPEGVLTKILNGMKSGALSDVQVVQALTAFSNHCTEDQWTQWYRPVLEKRLDTKLTITEFNKHCPDELRISGVPTLTPFVPVAKAGSLPQAFVLEPYTGSQRLLVMLRQDDVHVFLEDGTPVYRRLPKVLERFMVEDSTVMLELVDDNGVLLARDLLLWEQYKGDEPHPPVDLRLKALTQMLAGTEVEVVEYSLQKTGMNHRDEISLTFQMGYSGVILRNEDSILVHPKRKSVLTCTKTDEYLWGKGRMNKQSFESPVFHGLTSRDRELISQGPNDFIGRRFEVLSCGLDANGRLIFPVFQRWKDQE